VGPVRDEFTASARKVLGHRAGFRCSQPECGASTSGPGSEPTGVVDLGMAAHITAASPGGPRYDASLTREQRKDVSNGIWTCHNCGKLIDSDESRHTVELLWRWKEAAEARAAQMLAAGVGWLEPPLDLPIPEEDAEDSVLSYASTILERVGRRAELDELIAFLAEDRPFAWWLWTGPAGVGKSRLAVELCRMVSDDWDAGFLPDTQQSRLGGLRPVSPTLVVVDYAAQRSDWLSDVLLDLARRRNGPPLRVLILERAAAGGWWERVQRQHRLSEAAPIAAAQYRQPRELGGLDPDELRQLISGVSVPRGATLSSTDVEDVAEHTARLDPNGSPLWAVVATLDWLNSSVVSTGRDEALRRLIQRATVTVTRNLAEPRASLTRHLHLLATCVGGLSLDRYSTLLTAGAPPAGLLPGPFELPSVLFEQLLEGLRPDLLGELLVLDQLETGGIEQHAAQTLLRLAVQAAPEAYGAFVGRAARDHRDHPRLIALLEVLSASVEWAGLAVELIPLMRRSDHPVVIQILERLDALAAAGEPAVAELEATARFRHANLIRAEGDAARANDLYTRTLATAHPGWPIHASLLNNRGITWLTLGRVDLAVADFTAVIEAPSATDEARACALNNRADTYENDDAGAAIVDCSAVLALTDTTYDRRYIALSRRARVRYALGDRRGTYEDLEAILQTEDIAVEQKMETRLQRAELHRQRGRIEDAVMDLRAVVSSARNFENVEQAARQMLVEVGRA